MTLREEIAKKTYSFRLFRLQQSLLTPSWEDANIHIKKACFEFSDIILALLNKQLESEKIISTHILRNWDREKIKGFALHLLGDKYQEQL